MSRFAEKYLWVPWPTFCGWCNHQMHGLARIALFARAMGWRYGDPWRCPEHRAAVYTRREAEYARLLQKPRGFSTSAPPIPAPASPAPVEHSTRSFGLVLVVAESSSFPFAEQLEQQLLRRLAANPTYPLAPEAKVTTVRVPALPAETRSALEPFVWSLQERHKRRGGRWQTVFQPTTLGVTFLVIYLE